MICQKPSDFPLPYVCLQDGKRPFKMYVPLESASFLFHRIRDSPDVPGESSKGFGAQMTPW